MHVVPKKHFSIFLIVLKALELLENKCFHFAVVVCETRTNFLSRCFYTRPKGVKTLYSIYLNVDNCKLSKLYNIILLLRLENIITGIRNWNQICLYRRMFTIKSSSSSASPSILSSATTLSLWVKLVVGICRPVSNVTCLRDRYFHISDNSMRNSN